MAFLPRPGPGQRSFALMAAVLPLCATGLQLFNWQRVDQESVEDDVHPTATAAFGVLGDAWQSFSTKYLGANGAAIGEGLPVGLQPDTETFVEGTSVVLPGEHAGAPTMGITAPVEPVERVELVEPVEPFSGLPPGVPLNTLPSIDETPTVPTGSREAGDDDRQGARAKAKSLGLPLVFIEGPIPLFGDNTTELPEKILDLYGEPVCAGANDFARGGSGGAPATFCRYRNKQADWTIDGQTLDFDQFALERLMLGRWADSPARCVGDGKGAGDWCRRKAEVVVVPSVEFNYMLEQGPSWRSVQQSWWRNRDKSSWKEPHMRYWRTLMHRYFTPSVPGKLAAHSPLIVVHSSFTNIVAQLLALAELPPEFSRRIVHASLETNLRVKQQLLLPNRDWWANGLEVDLAQRAAARRKEQEGVQVLLHKAHRVKRGSLLKTRPREAAEFQVSFNITPHRAVANQASVLALSRPQHQGGGSPVVFYFLPGTTRLRAEVQPPPHAAPGGAEYPDGSCDAPSSRGELVLGKTVRVRARLRDGVFTVSINGEAACSVKGTSNVTHRAAASSKAASSEAGRRRQAITLKVWASTNGGADADATIAELTYARLQPQVRPLLITMPYPTSILRTTSFSEQELLRRPRGLDSSLRGWFPRRIAASLIADPSKSSGKENWIRGTMFEQLKSHRAHRQTENGSEDIDHSFVCAPGTKGQTCGLGDGSLNMWDVTSNSAFCIEPPGDTPTRSHFYIAVLSGCIPVIFDGGHRGFDGSVPTWWAWRHLPATKTDLGSAASVTSPFVDFSEFAVVYNASYVQTHKQDIVKELLDMPTKDPTRFWALRRGVDRVAPRMRFAPRGCTEDCDDAFAAFEAIVKAEWSATTRQTLLEAA